MIKSKLYRYDGNEYLIINPKSEEFKRDNVFIKRFTVMGTKNISYKLTIEIILYFIDNLYIARTYDYANRILKELIIDLLKEFFNTYKESVYLFVTSNHKEIRDLARESI